MTQHKEIEFLLCDTGFLWRKLYTQYTESLNLVGHERRVLLTLSAYPYLTQVEIADKIEIEPQALVRILDRLEQKHWIKKMVSPTDRRAKCLELTVKGRAMVKKIKSIADQLRPKVLTNLTTEEIKRFTEILNILKMNLEKMILTAQQ